MAKKKLSVLKRQRQNKKRALRNKQEKSKLKTFIKKARLALASGNLEEAEKSVQLAISKIDKAKEHDCIHPNTAARKKSRLMKKLNSLKTGQKAESSA